MSNLPWCLIGDYNDILDAAEKHDRVERAAWLINGFRNTILECSLSDIQIKGYPFTWFRRRGLVMEVEERLDKALVTPGWWALYPDSRLHNLIATISDHNPLLLTTETVSKSLRSKKFRFENHWMLEDGLEEVVDGSWVNGGHDQIKGKIANCSMELEAWGNNI